MYQYLAFHYDFNLGCSDIDFLYRFFNFYLIEVYPYTLSTILDNSSWHNLWLYYSLDLKL